MPLEWDNEHIPAVKLGLHVAQIVLSFVCWCLEIVVLRNDKAEVTGENGWTFAVCFLSAPAWIYLIMAPRWPRTRRLANPHAMVAVDALFTILWLSAFATQAAFNSANKCGTACGVSKAIVALGVFITLLFGGTTFLSIATLKYYDFNGHLPGYENLQRRNQNIDPDKAAFSTAPHDEEAYAPVGMNDHDHDHDEPEFNAGGSYGGSTTTTVPHDPHDPDAYNMSSLGRRHDDPFADSHEYAGAGSTEYQPSHAGGAAGGQIYAPPTAHDDYDEDRPAQFPAGNYGRIH